jgi:hypothetical protein
LAINLPHQIEEFKKMRKSSVVPGLLAGLVLLSLPGVSSAGVYASINIAPPALEVYEQPMNPTDGYIWTPGYWAYGDRGYYWVRGAWVAPPQVGFLWTPGYWGYADGLYAFNVGYWGPTVGFYGGVNYGFGYGGTGYDGGRWQGQHFSYNTSVSRVNTSVIHNTYSQNVGNGGNNRTSFNGGPSGTSARPSSAETATARQHGQGGSAPAAQQRASAGGPTQARQAMASNHGAPQQAQHAAPQQAQRAAPQEQRQQEQRQAASAPSRPAPQQERQQAPRAAAPQQQQRAAPEQRAAAPQQHAAPQQQHGGGEGKPAEGRK